MIDGADFNNQLLLLNNAHKLMTHESSNLQPYIYKAKIFYEGLLHGELKSYSSIVYYCLYEVFKIRTIDDIRILIVASKIPCSKYVYWDKEIQSSHIEELSTFIHSCDDDEAYNNKDSAINFDNEIKKLENSVNGQFLKSYYNIYKSIILAQEIIKNRQIQQNTESIKLQDHRQWTEKIANEFKQVNQYKKLVKFCIAYIYFTQTDVVKKHFQILPLRFYSLIVKSICKAEYIYVADYKNIFKDIDNIDGMDAFAVLPEIVTYGIEPIRETIDRCDSQYNALLDTRENITKNIYLESYVESKFHLPKYKNEQISVNTGQWLPIVDILKLAYEISVIDIAYISSSHNIRLLMSLIKGIKDLREYYKEENIGFINSIEKGLWDEVEKLNQMLCVKAAILLSQIVEQKQPDDDSSMMPRLHYNISENAIKHTIDEANNISGFSNPFVNFCKENGDYNIKSIADLFKTKNIIPLNRDSIIGYEGINGYNEYVNRGIELSLGQTHIYIAIKKLKVEKPKLRDEMNFVKILDEYMADKSSDILLKVVPPSLYVKSIKCLCKITDRHINNDVSFADKSLGLIDRLLGLLRLANLAYKDQSITPYRFRPLFEYSFYEYSNNNLLPVDAYKYDDFIEYLTYTDNVLFISSFRYPHPINYDYLENFYFCYNRIVHQYHYEIHQKLIIQKEKEIIDKANSQMNEERKKTIQLLGVFGTFIAFVSSIAGMIKSVDCIVDFILFCMTFIVCLLIFIWCLYTFFTESKRISMWQHILSTIVMLAIIASFTYCSLLLFDIIKTDRNVIKSSDQPVNTSVTINNDILCPNDQ